ncbi:hypothetical protein CKM354_000001700 [Cercospora kikuchii]|uniref:Uncharacterized protein n=1 Tax=Cercospora kikuchii TaxID=84275 RepID=A0A9P3C8A0_9PEZI|nr:uncharacterized protein CKM354_000001700 [Cercospora kikuchii]GIZ36546.1 hypothetical protein CKM354_000001700 [Cercospora kikuchii]
MECRRHTRYWAILMTSTLLFLGFMAAATFDTVSGTYAIRLLQTRAHTDGRHCGRIPSEALQRDCTYDVIPGAWVHHLCHDVALEEEFLSLRNWTYFQDPNVTQAVSLDSIRTNGGPSLLYITPGQDYHDLHCAYTWTKLHRAILGSGMIDGHVGSLQHTLHCGHNAMGQQEDGAQADVAVFERISTSCRDLDDYRRRYSYQVALFGP